MITTKNKVEQAVRCLINGEAVVVVDDYDREFEGDLVIAAQKASKDILCFAMLHARGLMCLPTSSVILDKLEIPLMVLNSTDPLETPFTVSVDGLNTTTGMSVDDRMETIRVMLDKQSKPLDLKRPGHLFPLRARDELLLARRGHTEASIELMKLCNFEEVAIIIEIMNDNGMMKKGKELESFANEHKLCLISVEEISEYVYGSNKNNS